MAIHTGILQPRDSCKRSRSSNLEDDEEGHDDDDDDDDDDDIYQRLL